MTTTLPTPTPSSTLARPFDGLLCFGGADWWYHNRGHYDLQMMQHLAPRVPVLYVNSIGVRFPSPGEGPMFLTRIARKLKSLRRGYTQVSPRFAVLTPIVVPGRTGMALSQRFLAPQVRSALRRAGITRPLIWIECPAAAAILDQLDPVALVYQRTDRWERLPGTDQALIERLDQRLKQAADLTLYCSTFLFDRERAACRHAAYVDHGVDFSRFAAASLSPVDPDDLRAIPHPRIGYVGSLDAHTFDPPLFAAVAAAMPDLHFILVGPSSLPEHWCDLPNVHHLGKKPYTDVPAYMAACDVLIMPWNNSEWIQACNPIKLKEYLAVGRPVVSTPFPELARYASHVQIASDAPSFAAAIRHSLATPPDPTTQRQRVAADTWDHKSTLVLHHLHSVNITPSTPNLP